MKIALFSLIVLDIGILCIQLYSLVPILINSGKIVFSRVLDFVDLQKSAHKPIEDLYFIEHSKSWLALTYDIHENRFPTNNNVSKVGIVFVKMQIKPCFISYLERRTILAFSKTN